MNAHPVAIATERSSNPKNFIFPIRSPSAPAGFAESVANIPSDTTPRTPPTP